ncbi:MAG TPA: primosomal protein N' [Steroidobacteraceae bacterium]|nr:primosomal protein N' [Steroidobacteraceae bacterium]
MDNQPTRPILRIALDTPLRRLFDYLAPAGTEPAALVPGKRVRVPFGRRRTTGVLLEVGVRSQVPPHKLKPALELLDSQPVFDAALLGFLEWAADYYHHPIGEVVSAALPLGLRLARPLEEIEERWQLTAAGLESQQQPGKRAPRQRALLDQLARGALGASELAAEGPRWRDTLRELVRKGWVESVESAPARTAPERWTARTGPTLTDAQAQVVSAVLNAGERFGAWLLDGVTGSGKTEVYLRIVAEVLARGRQALVLVPEIGLTPQLVQRFAERFAAPLAVLHSSLNEGERLAAWRRAREGEAAIVIGTRSAVFTPLAHLGVVIVDEEHDGSYKQQEGFRYSARDLAVMRARRQDVPVILGSATPSLESLQNARERRYTRHVLPERPGEARHPHMSLVDLRQHAAESGLAGPVLLGITRHLEAAGQVLVYLNRRGYAPTLYCPGCGWIAPCKECDARMTVHLRSQRLRCHHCGADQPMPLGCPRCGHEIKPVGQGTERVEDLLRDRFPQVPLVRLDRDSVRRKGEMETLLTRVTSGEARILVGTQMLAKGHHFPDVTLVVVVNADQGLFSADFRASERLAQTIVQVAGRAGRASRPGEVLIQTEFPQHPLLVSLLEKGYEGFAAAALEERAAAHWPPFSRLALLRADAREGEAAMRFLEAAVRVAEPVPGGVRVLGPVFASMARRAGRHHAQLLIESDARTVLQRFLTDWMTAVEELRSAHRVHWSLDVDPQELM